MSPDEYMQYADEAVRWARAANASKTARRFSALCAHMDRSRYACSSPYLVPDRSAARAEGTYKGTCGFAEEAMLGRVQQSSARREAFLASAHLDQAACSRAPARPLLDTLGDGDWQPLTKLVAGGGIAPPASTL